MISSIYRNVNNGPAKRAVCCQRKSAASKERKPNSDAQFKTAESFYQSYTRKIQQKLATRS
jgi:hypothetical protein